MTKNDKKTGNPKVGRIFMSSFLKGGAYKKRKGFLNGASFCHFLSFVIFLSQLNN